MKVETAFLVMTLQLAQILGIISFWIWAKVWLVCKATAEQRNDLSKRGTLTTYMVHKHGKCTFSAALTVLSLMTGIADIITAVALFKSDTDAILKLLPLLVCLVSLVMNFKLFRASCIADAQLRLAHKTCWY
jgi:hypothetical protein